MLSHCGLWLVLRGSASGLSLNRRMLPPALIACDHSNHGRTWKDALHGVDRARRPWSAQLLLMLCRDREGVAKQPAQPPITQGAYLLQRFRETMPKATIAEQ